MEPSSSSELRVSRRDRKPTERMLESGPWGQRTVKVFGQPKPEPTPMMHEETIISMPAVVEEEEEEHVVHATPLVDDIIVDIMNSPEKMAIIDEVDTQPMVEHIPQQIVVRQLVDPVDLSGAQWDSEVVERVELRTPDLEDESDRATAPMIDDRRPNLSIVYKLSNAQGGGVGAATVSAADVSSLNTTRQRIYKCGGCAFESHSLHAMHTHARQCQPRTVLRPPAAARRHRPSLDTVSLERNERNQFACKLCPFVNRSAIRLKQHAYGHVRPDGVKCKYCSFKQPTSGFMQMHVRLHTKKGEEENSNDGSSAVATEASEEVPPASSPEKSRFTLMKERYAALREKRYKCTSCQYSCRSSALRVAHMRRKHVKKAKTEKDPRGKHLCRRCGVSLRTRAQWIVHTVVRHRVHRASLSRAASICSSASVPTSSFAAITTSLVNTLPVPGVGRVLKDVAVLLPCQECPYVAGCIGNLRLHQKHHVQPREDWTEQCDFCSFRCKGVAHIRRHARSHHDPTICRRRVILDQQMSGGMGEDSVDSTPRMSPSPGDSRKRQRVVDPHRVKCSKCPYRTRFNYDLSQHERHHGATGEYQFTCEHCDYGTKSAHHLAKHTALHERESTMGGETYEPKPTIRAPRRKRLSSSTTAMSAAAKSAKKLRKMAVQRASQSTAEETEAKTEKIMCKTKGGRHIGNGVQGAKLGARTLFVCIICPFKSLRVDALHEHSVGHQDTNHIAGNVQWQCAECRWACVTEARLAQHERLHNKRATGKVQTHEEMTEELLTTSVPAAMTAQITDLVDELTTVPQPPSDILRPRTPPVDVGGGGEGVRRMSNTAAKGHCPDCPFTSSDATILHNHMTHHGSAVNPETTPFLCPHCTFATRLSHDLRSHLMMHNSFNYKRRSMRGGGGEEPSARLQCRHDDCHFACTSSNRLVEHQWSYHDTRAETGTKTRPRHTPADKHQRRVQRRIVRLAVPKAQQNVLIPKLAEAMQLGTEPTVGNAYISCQMCEFRCTNPQLASQHNALHGQEPRAAYACDRCNYSTDDGRVLSFHQAHHHSMAAFVGKRETTKEVVGGGEKKPAKDTLMYNLRVRHK